MNSEIAWVLVSSGTQVQPQIILNPDYLPDYHSGSYNYEKSLSISKSSSKSLDLLAFFQFLANYRRESFLKNFLIISIKISLLQNVSLVFSLVIHVFRSYCLLS